MLKWVIDDTINQKLRIKCANILSSVLRNSVDMQQFAFEQISFTTMEALIKSPSAEIKESLIYLIGSQIMNSNTIKESFLEKDGLQFLLALYLNEGCSIKMRGKVTFIIFDLLKNKIALDQGKLQSMIPQMVLALLAQRLKNDSSGVRELTARDFVLLRVHEGHI